MSVSQVRQNFHEDSEAGINAQINMELYASYAYLSMAAYFDRDDVALQNFSEYFKKAGLEEREHAEKLVKYQNMRGGRVTWLPIKAPAKADWESPLGALQAALQLEKDVNQSLLDLHKVADKHGDAQMTDYLEGEFLAEQVEAIKELADHITNINRVGAGLGEYVFDKETLG